MTRKSGSKKATSSPITAETVGHVAKIARLTLTEAEKKKYRKDLNDIVAAFRDIKSAKANVPPSFHPLDVKDVYRDDEAEKCLGREEALKNTEHKEDGFFRGPRAV